MTAGDDEGAFLEALTDSTLYSIGAHFTDRSPDLVEDVLAQSEEIEEVGLAAWAEREDVTLEPDENELKLLKELGYDALLMVAIEGGDGAWGLVEVYGEKGRRFKDEEVELAQDLAGEVGEILKQLERPTA